MNKIMCFLFGHRWKHLGMKRGEVHTDWDGNKVYKIEYHSVCERCWVRDVKVPADENDY